LREAVWHVLHEAHHSDEPDGAADPPMDPPWFG